MLLLMEKYLQWHKWRPYKDRGVVSFPIYAKKERNNSASADQGLFTASQDSHYVHGTLCLNPPTSPIPPLLLVQNHSSKWIAPTDNMQLKLHEQHTRHHAVVKVNDASTQHLQLLVTISLLLQSPPLYPSLLVWLLPLGQFGAVELPLHLEHFLR